MPNGPTAEPPGAAPSATPSTHVVANLRRELMQHAPFALMAPEHVDHFIAASSLAYFAPGETVLDPQSGPVGHLYLVRQGSITGRKGLAEAAGGFLYEAGDLFPVGAALGRRPVTATYEADEDCFCLMLPVGQIDGLAAISAAFADYLNRRAVQFLDLSRRAVQASYASRTLAEQSLEASLGSLPRKQPLAVLPGTALGNALQLMHDRRVGSVLVTDAESAPLGILTRHDVLGRITLPQVPLDTPIERIMSSPIRTLDVDDTAQDAVLLMTRHGIRHVPVLEDGRVVSIVSERDLFALQRLSLKSVSEGIRAARDVEHLRDSAAGIRRFARNLMGQGVHARQLTELISHLNDLLAERLAQLMAERHGLDLQRACWLAFGSEGRSEQTVATDQDNGLVFESDAPDAERPRWLAFARDVNEALDTCGYPLCKGNVMASNPACCLTPAEWTARFDNWMEHGAPQDLLNASIFFDLRGVAGRLELAQALRTHITEQAARLPRFMKQLALNALAHRPPLNWRGGIDTHDDGGRRVIDLKLQGTAIVVDAARIYALAHGIPQTGTRARLEGYARAIGIDDAESQAWITGFEFLQSLRLRVQIEGGEDGDASSPEPATHAAANPNLVDVPALNDIDRRVLRETLRVARRLQQRLELDYQR